MQADDAAAALLYTKDEIGIRGECLGPDDPDDGWSKLRELGMFPVMVPKLGALSFSVGPALPAHLEARRQPAGLSLIPLRLSGDRDLLLPIIGIGEEVETPFWRLESEALNWPP